MLILRILTGRHAGYQTALGPGSLTIGSASTCDLRLGDPGISDSHARVELREGRWVVCALAPGASVSVNGQPVEAELLEAGDILSLASVMCLLDDAGDPSPVPKGRNELISRPPLSRDETIRLRLSSEQVDAYLSGADEDDDELRHAKRQLRAIYAINGVLGETLDAWTLLDQVLRIVMRTVRAERGVAVSYPSGSGEHRHLVSLRQRDDGSFQPEPQVRISRSIAEHVVATGEAVLTADATQDMRFSKNQSVLSLRLKSAMCVPLRGRQSTMGLLFVEADRRTVFVEESLRLLACVGEMAGKVLEAARLHRTLVERQRLATIGETLASTAHYIKNLLTGISAGSELVRMGLEEGDLGTLREGWNPVQRSLGFLQDFVLNMLDYSKDRPPLLERVDLRELFDDLLAVLRVRAEGREVRVETEVAAEAESLVCDRMALHRATLNLLINALDAIPSGRVGQVRLVARACSDPEGTEISVSDNGEGIAPELQGKLFDLFASTKGRRGTGFGLAVTRKIVQEHGGTVRVLSRPGEGTTFTLRLPRLEPTVGA